MSEGSKCQRLEVLDDGGEVEFVACTRQAAEPHAFEAVVNLQMGEAHLDTFALVARFGECLCLHLPPRDIAGVFMNVARDLSRRRVGTALPLECTDVAVVL